MKEVQAAIVDRYNSQGQAPRLVKGVGTGTCAAVRELETAERIRAVRRGTGELKMVGDV